VVGEVTSILQLRGDVILWVTNKYICIAIGVIFMKIKEEINTCSWRCKFVGRVTHGIYEY
jgi:hypothetical protein